MLKRVAAILFLAGLAWAAADNLTVTTRTGTFIGGLNDTYPDVRHFKYIPYANPPVGAKRWTSPEPLDNSSEVIDSTVFGPACAQYVSAIPTAWALNITGNLIVNYGESLLAGQVAQNSAEDCLTLAIWTPTNATADSKLPVIHFLTGGGDVTGGIDIPTQLPAHWVHLSHSHIVITTNYRVNIFSYPNARGLSGSTNFALQDQRLAVEWDHLWGQSAGSSATDMYLFSFYEDPIVRATISSSGFAIGHATNADYAGTNFTFVAKNMGCDFEDAETELQCMRRIPMDRIENFIGQYQDNSTLVNTSQPAIAFTRQADNKYVFTNYTERYLNGQIAKLPKILGTTAREASALDTYPINDVAAGPNETLVVINTLATVCDAYNTSVLREELGLTTYRYEWAGNFSNIAPVTWLGAYHYSDLYMFFGSYVIAPGEITDLEVQTSVTMQNYLLDFIKDPTSLPANGWPAYQVDNATTSGTLAQFGADGQVVQFVDGNTVEGACHILGDTYNTTP
ncbi:alpha/beta-hydrolase [Gymnopus androsaceus JB14]|uniref:Alpha/beta-hydrolase n=1 Tax=Gymnopus androsaceus JB14 TaxID=1447944 RepID=A0A6A4HJ11_9AGAR|nr:alpha/beta-hydrolase [Gymnopus androsaceus JB14]